MLLKNMGLENLMLYSIFFGPGEDIPMFGNPKDLSSKPLRIRDLPNIGTQLHLHGSDLDNVTYGRIYPYNRETFKELNGYETSMADLYADLLGFKKKDLNKE